jgi:HAMP domain-containing protein
MSAAFLVIVAVILMILFYQILFPIGEIKREMQKFADGDRSIRIHSSSEDELAGITQVFNKMADDINVQILNLERMSSTYYRFVPQSIIELLGKDNLQARTAEFYCCHPDAYYGDKRTVAIPCVDKDSSVPRVLANAFDITGEMLTYKEQYIYFSSVYDFEGGRPIGELDVVKRIEETVGKENLLIKKHPRDRRSVWSEEGFRVDVNSRLPWEAVQLAMDCTDKVFITANSGSVLSVNMLLKPMPRVIFVYPCCDLSGNPTAQNTIDTIEKLLDNPRLQNMLINVSKVENVEDIAIQ